jgi:pimeloyl-ACP methyl ester carboxylesterase
MFPEQRTLGRFRGLVARGGLDFPPILAIHGAFGHPAQFTPLMTAMAQRGFTFYALPLSGHVEGTSDAVRGLGLRDYCRDVVEMLRHFRSPPVLLGHSMGGLICEKVAEKSAVAGLILAAAAPAAPLMATLKALPTWFGLMPRMLRGAPLMPPRDAIGSLAFVNTDKVEREALLADVVPESGRAMRDMIIGAVKVERTAIRCPVLSFFGDMDNLVPPWQMRAEARRLRATVVEYRGAGHYLMEHPWIERIADDIAAWISRSVVAPPPQGRLTNAVS